MTDPSPVPREPSAWTRVIAWWTPEWKAHAFWLASLALLLVYGTFRQRYLWGVDSFGYYQLGKLMSEGRVLLETTFPTHAPEPLVPWGFHALGDGRAVPQYPPGFSLLLAIGHLLRAPLWVTPACGVISCWLMFGLLRTRVAATTALMFTAAWAVMPLTIYGSTMLMSDLVATATLMGGLLAFRHQRVALAAWVFGFSIMVRPTNVFFLLPFALLLKPDRTALRFGFHFAIPCALYALYNHLLFGAPWKTGYGSIGGSFSADIVPQFFMFFSGVTWTLLSPVMVLLAALALARPTRERLFLLLWALVFAVFYSFWAGGATDRWWWARFILPGYPALFLLAAEGWESARAWGLRRIGRLWPAVVALPVLALPVHYLKFGWAQNDLWLRTTGVPNYELVQQVRARVPAGSLVGSLEHASTLHVYTDLTPFVSVHRRTPELVEDALAQGRSVYLLPEPWLMGDEVVQDLLRRFQAVEIARFDSPWAGQQLFELRQRAE
jgi:hypothetical protein